ncbi:polysaccharide deacetylase family protein [Chondromyces apiculatus]|uniref:NodB homology domain-containing protein n=1 Tax=Chondromyces apiculatus DSM 436 TaxID=1192034 RepID=A0A017SZB6_9BACT|nr:polysaccharide deacetylase family protein [Chondromyces apiculatus]EYF01631.1 Hypothetical protein CAP_7950 [Chondromyces apiculatus DSM 436]
MGGAHPRPEGERLAAISIDLDEVHHYLAIHALPTGNAGAHAVYDAALPRIASFATEHDIPVTLFAVGEDLLRPESAASLRALSDAGHAVENHSFRHRYDLTRLSHADMRAEVARGAAEIARVTGRAPRGFRAPGYTVNDALFDVLEALGVRWDSSVFPCPPYYLAKALVLQAQRVQGKRSAAILGSPRVLGAPVLPYRPGVRWWEPGDRELLELPIQVTRAGRLPVIGTSVGRAGVRGARWLAGACPEGALVQLELHGMDFLDAADGLGALAAHQPELQVSLGRRLDALSAFVKAWMQAGRRFVLLDDAAEALASTA